MASRKHLKRLREGVDGWNAWRAVQSSSIVANLSRANLIDVVADPPRPDARSRKDRLRQPESLPRLSSARAMHERRPLRFPPRKRGRSRSHGRAPQSEAGDLDRRREVVEHPFGSIKQWMYQDHRSAASSGPVGPQDIAAGRPSASQHALRLPLVLSRVHWVEPKLVAEITYLTWTAGCALIQPSAWAAR